MTLTADVAAIFADARSMYAGALERLAEGDTRDAAEKSWCAVKRSTDALILARTGEEPERTPLTSRLLDRLAGQDARVKPLVGRYYSRQTRLHGDCFYLGLCDDPDTERRIRETGQYIDEVEALALDSG